MLRLIMVIAAGILAAPAAAQTVNVSTGEHSDFTRVVLEFPEPSDWTMGRTADGYELRLPGDARTYDLSTVFDIIKRDRLAAIWADPVTGALHMSIGCACYAMPFEFRPGTVVIDIRNGAPPKGSSFELALDGGGAVAVATRPTVRPVKRPKSKTTEVAFVNPALPQQSYDWTAGLLDAEQDGLKATSGDHLSGLAVTKSTQLTLEPLRQSLIEQLSRGASQGIVEMAKPRKPGTTPSEESNPSVEIRLGDAPNLLVRQKGEQQAPLTAEGAKCVEDDKLDVASWAAETPVLEQIGPILSGLTGEFDKPDPEAIKQAIRFYLNLGFGAEAKALLRTFPIEHEDAAIWISMARLLDGEADVDPAFAGMSACDTAAALWSVLSDPQTLAVGQVEKAAILRAFSALPNHLRRQLGPTLVTRFLTMEDFSTAIALRDAVLRGTSAGGPEIELMEAAIERAGGSPSTSAARLESVASEPGPKTAEALMILVTQRAELGQDVSFDQVQALEEYTNEREGSPDYAAFSHALTLAYGASGDFEAAFDRVETDPEAAPTLWQILGQSGSESALLDIATLNDRQQPPPEATGAAALIAHRMLKLGLFEQAAQWIALAEAPPDLLSARVALANGNAERALDLVKQDQSPGAFEVRVQALQSLGESKAVAELFAEQGMTDEQWSVITRMQDWETLAASGPEVWKNAAQSVTDVTDTVQPEAGEADAAMPTGPLARSQTLLSQSEATRGMLEALLQDVKSPAMLTQ